MSLFGDIFGGIASIFTGNNSKRAARDAANAQVQAAQMGVDESRRQFDIAQQNYAPYLKAGTSALGNQGDLLGLNGSQGQQAAIEALKASPLYQSLFSNGLEANLQNASATGGIRGGNAVRSLADFGRDTLAQTIQQQVGNLGAVAGQGAASTGQLGALGASQSQLLASLFNQQGAARAGGILGAAAAKNSQIVGVSNALASIANTIPLPGFGSFKING